MSDPFNKVIAGQRLHIPAVAYNAFLDAAQANSGRRFGQTSPTLVGHPSSGIVRIKNASEDDRSRFDILGIDGPLFDADESPDAFLAGPMFSGLTPDIEAHTAWAILLEPIPAGHIGLAMIDGVTLGRVRLAADSDIVRYATIADEDAIALAPAADGPVQVLWHEAAAGASWAILRLGNTPPARRWVRIVTTADAAGVYTSWQEVELADLDDGTPWTAPTAGLEGPGDGSLYEVNATPRIPDDTIVCAFDNPAWLSDATQPRLLFAYESAASIGYGIPVAAQADVPAEADLLLTITDAAGTAILDGDEAEQTITVWRNATHKALYTDFAADTIFTYIRYPWPETTGHEGCIFSRTEAFLTEPTYLPADGYPLHDDPAEIAPLTIDATGDPSDASHLHILGHMYMHTADAVRGWAPWIVIDPAVLGLGKVYTDAADTTAGYLNDEIIVAPAAGHAWLTKAITPGGAHDNTLLLTHADWDSANVTAIGSMASITAAGANVSIIASTATPAANTAWFSFTEFEDRYDATHHSTVAQKTGAYKLVISLPDPLEGDGQWIGSETWVSAGAGFTYSQDLLDADADDTLEIAHLHSTITDEAGDHQNHAASFTRGPWYSASGGIGADGATLTTTTTDPTTTDGDGTGYLELTQWQDKVDARSHSEAQEIQTTPGTADKTWLQLPPTGCAKYLSGYQWIDKAKAAGTRKWISGDDWRGRTLRITSAVYHDTEANQADSLQDAKDSWVHTAAAHETVINSAYEGAAFDSTDVTLANCSRTVLRPIWLKMDTSAGNEGKLYLEWGDPTTPGTNTHLVLTIEASAVLTTPTWTES